MRENQPNCQRVHWFCRSLKSLFQQPRPLRASGLRPGANYLLRVGRVPSRGVRRGLSKRLKMPASLATPGRARQQGLRFLCRE